MIVWAPVAAGMYDTEQVAVLAVCAASVHGEPVNDPPASVDVNVTVPVGAVGALVETSVTVAVHEVAEAAATGLGLHVTDGLARGRSVEHVDRAGLGLGDRVPL